MRAPFAPSGWAKQQLPATLGGINTVKEFCVAKDYHVRYKNGDLVSEKTSGEYGRADPEFEIGNATRYTLDAAEAVVKILGGIFDVVTEIVTADKPRK